jgi:hypothetical protein
MRPNDCLNVFVLIIVQLFTCYSDEPYKSMILPVHLEYFIDNSVTSTESNTDMKHLQNIAAINYPKYIKCLENTPLVGKSFKDNSGKEMTIEQTPFDKLTLPNDAEMHYKYLLEQTQSYRQVIPHNYAGYQGPWIENHFIHNFINKPLSYFSGWR